MMRSFFGRPDTQWRSLSGALHFYALPEPEDDIFSAYGPLTLALDGFEGLAVQPAKFVHVTVQRLDLYHDELSDVWDGAMDVLATDLRSLHPFRLDFAAPVLAEDAIEARAVAMPEWDALARMVRAAVAAGGAAATLRAGPRVPHYSLAYCRVDRPVEPVRLALAKAGRSTSMIVRRLALVGVNQHRDSGIFTFDTVRTWRIGE